MAIEEELEAVWHTYVSAYRAGDAAGCASIFTQDAEVHSPYGPVARGRAAIQAVHADWTSEGAEGKVVSIRAAGQDGDLAWCLAAFAEGDMTGSGTSLNVLERQPGGQWRIRMCSLNEDGGTDA